MAATGSNGRPKGYFTYAELLFTLCAAMWCSAFAAPSSMGRSIQLVLFGLIGVAGLGAAVVKARLRAKDLPKAWLDAIAYCVVAFLVVLVASRTLGGTVPGVIVGLVVWGLYQSFMLGVFSRRR